MNTEISRDQLIHIIKGKVGEKRTGTLYVRSEDSRSIVVGIDSGQIVTLNCPAGVS